MIVPLPQSMVDELWPVTGKYIADAIERTDSRLYHADDIRVACLTGQMVMWVYATDDIHAAVVTEIHNFPRGRVCNIPFAGGRKLREWAAPMKAEIAAYARAMGCRYAFTSGRSGWARVSGFDNMGSILRMEL